MQAILAARIAGRVPSRPAAWGPLIPFCARCQAMSAAALQETRNVVGEITRLDAVTGDRSAELLP